MSVEHREDAMQEFIRKHEARIDGVLSCFDRMLFRGYLNRPGIPGDSIS